MRNEAMQKTRPGTELPESPRGASAASDLREGLPVLSHAAVVLREVRIEDAPALLAHLGTAEVTRFVASLPTTVEGFEELIASAHQERAQGACVCMAVVPAGADHAVGLLLLKALEPNFATAEWTFALGSSYWGSGLFLTCARLLLDFAFGSLGVVRLEARVATMNGRGNGALRKVGAVQEGVLRRSFKHHGQRHDQLLWAVLAEDWRLHQRQRPRLVH